MTDDADVAGAIGDLVGNLSKQRRPSVDQLARFDLRTQLAALQALTRRVRHVEHAVLRLSDALRANGIDPGPLPDFREQRDEVDLIVPQRVV